MEHSLCVLQEHLSDIIISSNARDIAEHHGMTAPILLHSTYHMLYDISHVTDVAISTHRQFCDMSLMFSSINKDGCMNKDTVVWHVTDVAISSQRQLCDISLKYKMK